MQLDLKPPSFSRLISVAPMMRWTHRHFRYFLRLMSSNVLLYTVMLTEQAILRGDARQILAYDALEHPLALQLGGRDPQALAQCARIAEDLGYDEINLNVGCPSKRALAGGFGACLMKEPEHVADCVAAMAAAVKIPVTVKTRIGVDHEDSYERLVKWVDTVTQAGSQSLLLHARKAWLKGLNPRQNRSVPPLRYDWLARLKQDRPQQSIIANGGLTTLEEIREQLVICDGVMIGRALARNPYWMVTLESEFFGGTALSRAEVLEAYFPYLQAQLRLGAPQYLLLQPLFFLMQGCDGARSWRSFLGSCTAEQLLQMRQPPVMPASS